MKRHAERSSLRSATLLVLCGLLGACRAARPAPEPAIAHHVLIVGRVVDGDGNAVTGASVTSAASEERQCDEHSHLGGGVPDTVRTDPRGAFRQLVVTRARPGCIQVRAASADGTRSGTSTIIGSSARPVSAGAPDSSRVDVILR